jgi:hypothetical protein
MAAGLAAAAMLAGALGFALVAGHAGPPTQPLPDGGAPPPGRTHPAERDDPLATPSPNDAQAAVPDVDPARTRSPAQGPVRLTVHAAPPPGAAGAAYQAYLGWVRGYLGAYARPGRPDGLDRYATPVAARLVRAGAAALAARGWAEYGSAVLVSVTVQAAGRSATVRACLDLSGLATRDAAGRLGGRDHPVGATATLIAAHGRWLVSDDAKKAVPGCR